MRGCQRAVLSIPLNSAWEEVVSLPLRKLSQPALTVSPSVGFPCNSTESAEMFTCLLEFWWETTIWRSKRITQRRWRLLPTDNKRTVVWELVDKSMLAESQELKAALPTVVLIGNRLSVDVTQSTISPLLASLFMIEEASKLHSGSIIQPTDTPGMSTVSCAELKTSTWCTRNLITTACGRWRLISNQMK